MCVGEARKEGGTLFSEGLLMNVIAALASAVDAGGNGGWC